MSFSIEMRAVPSRTLQMVNIDESRIFVEAWASDDADKQALKDICDGLSEDSDILVEATETRWEPETTCGVRRLSWMEIYEKRLLGRTTLVLHMSLMKPGSD